MISTIVNAEQYLSNKTNRNIFWSNKIHNSFPEMIHASRIHLLNVKCNVEYSIIVGRDPVDIAHNYYQLFSILYAVGLHIKLI